MKAKEILELENAINNCSNLKGLKFIYNLAKNSKIIKEFKEVFDIERMKLIDEFCQKDKNGENIVINGVFKLNDADSFNKKYNELLENDVTIDLFTINQIDVPEDISSGQLIGIYPIIIVE